MSLTVAYITARHEPRFDWFFQSLMLQKGVNEVVTKIIVVDQQIWNLGESRRTKAFESTFLPGKLNASLSFTKPKPTVWAGPSRLTKEDWWSASNSRNTAICLCKNDWIAFLDDRCVLQPRWLGAIRNAMERGYGVFGSYEKRTGITVKNGVIEHAGIVTGEDGRRAYVKEHRADNAPTQAPGAWAFGCNLALPIEWCLKVNGFDESCDSLSMEDVIFGAMLENNNFPLQYDHRMAVVQDRTPGQTGPAINRSSKEKHPHDETDKGHEALRRFGKQKQSSHHWNIREIRDQVLAGKPFPRATQPTHDWYDNQPLSEFDGKRIQ